MGCGAKSAGVEAVRDGTSPGGARTRQETRRRLVLAFLFAPISFGLFGMMLSGLWALKIAALVGYPIALVVGAPSYLLFRKLGWNGLLSYLVLSALCSVILIWLFVLGPIFAEGNGLEDLMSTPRLAQMGLAAFVATLSVLIFWLIARPDRSQ